MKVAWWAGPTKSEKEMRDSTLGGFGGGLSYPGLGNFLDRQGRGYSGYSYASELFTLTFRQLEGRQKNLPNSDFAEQGYWTRLWVPSSRTNK